MSIEQHLWLATPRCYGQAEIAAVHDNLAIVLVNPSHPGNIGATARAMQTMGLHRLYLVAPDDFPSPLATALAAGADAVLAQATVVATLAEAIAECQFVVGASARIRGISLPLLSPPQCADALLANVEHGPVALVLGREDKGLTNAQLQHCHQQVHIPANPDFSSLNLGAAVQVLCYEVRMAWLRAQQATDQPADRPLPTAQPLATIADMEHFYDHLYATLQAIGFLEHSSHEAIMAKLRRLYGRVRPDQVELNILRGILSATQALHRTASR